MARRRYCYRVCSCLCLFSLILPDSVTLKLCAASSLGSPLPPDLAAFCNSLWLPAFPCCLQELPNTSPSATPPFGDRFGMSGRPRANTWQGWLQEFGYELVRQGGQSLIVMACSFFFMWLFGMLPSE